MNNRIIGKRATIIFCIIFLAVTVYYSSLIIAGNSGAIIVSGTDENAMETDVSVMEEALTDTSVGYAVPSTNTYTGTNVSFSDFQNAISQSNSQGISELHIYISTHMSTSGDVVFSDGAVSSNDFVSAINQSNASTIHITIDACYSGVLYNDLNAIVGQDGSVITSSDSKTESKYTNFLWLHYSWFTKTLAEYLQDSDSDLNEDGVTYEEALNRLKNEGGYFPNYGHPKSFSIPTLSEWKKIFLTLLMLSLVMGFTPNQLQTTAFSNGIAMSRITCINALAFNRQLYYFALKWVGVVVVLGLAGVTVASGHLKMVDLLGTLFCAPLVAYILHLVISFIHDYKGISG